MTPDGEITVTDCVVGDCVTPECGDAGCLVPGGHHHHPAPEAMAATVVVEEDLPLVPFRWNMCVQETCLLRQDCPTGWSQAWADWCPAAQHGLAHHHHFGGYGLGTAYRRPGHRQDTFVPRGAYSQVVAAEGVACVISHGIQTGTETFVPAGKTVAFYTRHGKLLLVNEWMRVASVGDVATEVFASGDIVHNYEITALSFHDQRRMEQAIGTVPGVPYLAGFNLATKIRLCSDPSTCQAYREQNASAVHAPTCTGLFGYLPTGAQQGRSVIPQAEIRLYTCRSAEGDNLGAKNPESGYNPEQMEYRRLLAERAEALDYVAGDGDPLGARLRLGSYPPRTQADIRVSYEDESFHPYTPDYLSARIFEEKFEEEYVIQMVAEYDDLGEDEKRWLSQGDPDLDAWLKAQKMFRSLLPELGQWQPADRPDVWIASSQAELNILMGFAALDRDIEIIPGADNAFVLDDWQAAGRAVYITGVCTMTVGAGCVRAMADSKVTVYASGDGQVIAEPKSTVTLRSGAGIAQAHSVLIMHGGKLIAEGQSNVTMHEGELTAENEANVTFYGGTIVANEGANIQVMGRLGDSVATVPGKIFLHETSTVTGRDGGSLPSGVNITDLNGDTIVY